MGRSLPGQRARRSASAKFGGTARHAWTPAPANGCPSCRSWSGPSASGAQAAEALLEAARQAQPGETFTAAGQTLTRSVTHHGPRPAGSGQTTRAPASDATSASKKTTRSGPGPHRGSPAPAPACRVEELLEISHHSLVQYRLPTTGELVPLLQIAPSKTDAERLLLVSPELADVLSAPSSAGVRGTRRDSAPGRRSTTGTSASGWRHPRCCSSAGYRHREPRDQRPHVARDMLHAALAHTGLIDPGRRSPAALHPPRLPEDIHHRRHHERPAAAYRPGHRRPPGHQRDNRLQGGLPGRGDPGPPGVPGPAAGAAAHRGIPCPHRRGMARIPRPFRAPQGRHRNMRPRFRHPVHS